MVIQIYNLLPSLEHAFLITNTTIKEEAPIHAPFEHEGCKDNVFIIHSEAEATCLSWGTARVGMGAS